MYVGFPIFINFIITSQVFQFYVEKKKIQHISLASFLFERMSYGFNY